MPINNHHKGTALLVTILLAGAISVIAFGMTKIALSEMSVGTKGEEGIEAFYAAQAGTEDALMRFKFHDKASLSVPEDATKTSSEVARIYIDQENPPAIVSAGSDLSLGADNFVYDLKVWYKEKCTLAKPCEYELNKDESLLLDPNQNSQISVFWQIIDKTTGRPVLIPGVAEQDQAGLWYRLYDPENPAAIDPTGQNREFFTFLSTYDESSNPALQDQRFANKSGISLRRGSISNLSIRTARSLKFKAFLPNDNYKILVRIIADKEIGGPKLHIESTGYTGGTAKKIEVVVDRATKSILDVFDYVIYSGVRPLPR